MCAAFPSHFIQGLLSCFSLAVPTCPYQALSFQEPSSPANAVISFPAPALSTGAVQPGSLIPQLSCSLAAYAGDKTPASRIPHALIEGRKSLFPFRKAGENCYIKLVVDVECLGVFVKTASPPSVPNNFGLGNVHDAEIFSNSDLFLIPDRKQYVN